MVRLIITQAITKNNTVTVMMIHKGSRFINERFRLSRCGIKTRFLIFLDLVDNAILYITQNEVDKSQSNANTNTSYNFYEGMAKSFFEHMGSFLHIENFTEFDA